MIFRTHVFALALTAGLVTVASVEAALIQRDITVDTKLGLIVTEFDSGGNSGKDWRISIPIPAIVIAAGDTYIARVRFANGLALQISENSGSNPYNAGLEIAKF